MDIFDRKNRLFRLMGTSFNYPQFAQVFLLS